MVWPFRSSSTIEETIRTSIILISSLAVISMAALGWKLASDASQTTLRELEQISQEAVETRLRQNINAHVLDFEQIARSTLIGTALTDSFGREAYLVPFLEQRTAATGMLFALYDYRGRLLMRTGDRSRPVGTSQLYLAGPSASDFDVRIGKDMGIIEFEAPIRSFSDNLPIGFLIADLSIDLPLGDATLVTGKFFRTEVDLRILRNRKPTADEAVMMSTKDLALVADVQMLAASTSLPEVVRRLGFLGLLATGIVLLGSLIIARLTAGWISAPIHQLTGAVVRLRKGEIVEPIRGEMPKEVDLLATSLFRAFEERGAALKKLENLAHYDNLTGVLNRAHFDQEARTSLEVALRSDTSVALIYADLDRFKEINDTHGHDAGDHVLRTITNRMRDRLRTSDMIGRRGGDEFIILLRPAGSRDDVALLAWEIASMITAPIDIGPAKVSVGISMGVGFFPFDADDYDELVTRADQAMYEAKKAGRGQLVFCSGEAVQLRVPAWAPSSGPEKV